MTMLCPPPMGMKGDPLMIKLLRQEQMLEGSIPFIFAICSENLVPMPLASAAGSLSF